ncbi:MAG: DnaJ domain-containing protein [Gaiellaceae bacterium]
MSNYYEILGVWRDASEDDIDLAAQALDDHWRGALALNDPSATDWLQIIHQARKTLTDPEARAAYDRQLDTAVEEEENEAPVLSPGFPWRPYVCAILAVPVLLAAFVLVLAVSANSGSLTNATKFRDALLTTMSVTSAVAFSCGLVVLLIAARGKREQHRLRMLQFERGDDPLLLAEIDAAGRLSEYTDVAVWVTWGSDLVVIAIWCWLIVLLVGSA